jgi:hypothetical protein
MTSELSGDSDWNKVEKVENDIDDINDDDEYDDEYNDIDEFNVRRKRLTFGVIGTIGSLIIFSSILVKMIMR